MLSDRQPSPRVFAVFFVFFPKMWPSVVPVSAKVWLAAGSARCVSDGKNNYNAPLNLPSPGAIAVPMLPTN
jgi:hypothetical protein